MKRCSFFRALYILLPKVNYSFSNFLFVTMSTIWRNVILWCIFIVDEMYVELYCKFQRKKNLKIGIELLSICCRNPPKSKQVVGMANREELSHYILDFAMETSIKWTKNVCKSVAKLAKYRVSDFYTFLGCLASCNRRIL